MKGKKMKRVILVFSLLSTSTLFAVAGIGGYFLQDGYDIEADKSSTTGVGGYVYVDAIPFIDVEIGIDALGKTNYSYLIGENSSSISLPQKAGWYISVQRKIIKIPMMKFYYGLGLSQNKITPQLSEDYLLSLYLSDSDSEETVLKAVEKDIDFKSGYFLELGLRAKPWLIPLSINSKLRYNFIEDVVPDKKSYLSLIVGIGFAL